jgi:hypothetical protein
VGPPQCPPRRGEASERVRLRAIRLLRRVASPGAEVRAEARAREAAAAAEAAAARGAEARRAGAAALGRARTQGYAAVVLHMGVVEGLRRPRPPPLVLSGHAASLTPY